MWIELTGTTPTTTYSTDLIATVDTLHGLSLDTLIELCHVQFMSDMYGDGQTDAQIAALLSTIDPWASMADDAAREAAVAAARVTLAALAAA